MALPFFGRPKWKHADPAIRARAVAELTDQAALGEIARQDEVRAIRLAALERLNDPEVLVEIAVGTGDLAVPALERLTEEKGIQQVARTAASADVRCRAVCRIKDNLVLRRISAQDEDAKVRTQARMQLAGPDSLRQFLRSVMTGLEAAAATAEVGETALNLAGVCDALAQDHRFYIHGVMGDVKGETEHAPGSYAPHTSSSRFTADASLTRGRSAIELLASKSATQSGVGPAALLRSYYLIRIKRTGEDAFLLAVKERDLTAGA